MMQSAIYLLFAKKNKGGLGILDLEHFARALRLR
uniref:Uncharacterized protein n=1 Tax=Zea mays TaxID=4577 RepID=B6TKS7_MAIZE|nr:hypothetical protein [Zea mays]